MPNKNYILSILKYSLTITFPLVLILFFVLTTVSNFQDETELLLLKGDMTGRMSILQDLVAHDFNSVTSDLQILAESELLQDFISKSDDKNYKKLENFFVSYSNRKKLYDQIRFIDSTGMERVRINFNLGNPKPVKFEKLQNKKNRYYFKNVFELGKNEVFVSPMDLNIENGKIENPIKPMIRFGTPVFDKDGNKKGIVLLNYFGDYILDNIRSHYSDFSGKGMLLNSEGYFLLSNNSDECWGFMYVDKKESLFSNKYPNEWDSLLSKDKGQFSTSNGFFTFETVYPINEAWRSSKGTGTPFATCDYLVEGEKYFWKLLLHYPTENLKNRFSHRESKALLLFLISIIIFGLSILLSRAIYKRKAAEELKDKTLKSLKISKQKLKEENIAKDKFFSIISHDLKSPFQGIMGFGNMLATSHTEFTKDELNESLQILNNSILNVYNLLEGLLEWSRVQTGRLSLTPVEINIFESVDRIINLLALNASKKEIDIECNVDKNITLFIDEKLFETVIRNLTANAIKFTRINGVIKIYSKTIASEVKIIVEDNGIGISEKNQKKLFKLDIHHTTKGTNSEQGTGLGLILCKDLLEKANGKIEVESQLGVGSKFIITLPLGKSA